MPAARQEYDALERKVLVCVLTDPVVVRDWFEVSVLLREPRPHVVLPEALCGKPRPRLERPAFREQQLAVVEQLHIPAEAGPRVVPQLARRDLSLLISQAPDFFAGFGVLEAILVCAPRA